MKSREIYKLTYNQLAKLLKLEENSIRKVYEQDQGEEVLYILHDDERTSINYSDEHSVLKKKFDPLGLKQDMDLIANNIIAAFGFKPEDLNKYINSHPMAAEQTFNVKLHKDQIKAINDWNKVGTRKYNWERRTGASYCAVIDALFSACCGKLDVMYLSASLNESKNHFRMAKEILDKTTIDYRIENDSIFFPNGYSIVFRSNNTDPMGSQFSKMIFDNCDINRRITHSKCVAIREYTTYEE